MKRIKTDKQFFFLVNFILFNLQQRIFIYENVKDVELLSHSEIKVNKNVTLLMKYSLNLNYATLYLHIYKCLCCDTPSIGFNNINSRYQI